MKEEKEVKKTTSKKKTTTTTAKTPAKKTTTKKEVKKEATKEPKKTATKKVAATAEKTTAKATTKKTTAVKKEVKETKAEPKKTTTRKTVKKETPVLVEEVKQEKPKKEIKVEKNKDNEKTKPYKILSYIGILWLVGLFVPEKDDEDLKFHVGQGIILSIFELLLSIVVKVINNCIIFNIFKQQIYEGYLPTGLYTVSVFGSMIAGLLNLAVLFITVYYVIVGIDNAVNNKKEELPLIGKYSFYK